MYKQLVFFVPFFVMNLLIGCCPSITSLKEMRLVTEKSFETTIDEEKARASSSKRLGDLMQYFGEEEPKPVLWRAEAMTTMYVLGRWLQHSEDAADRHIRIKELLTDEYNEPNFEEGEDVNIEYDRDRLRAWSVHTLGLMPDDDLDPFLVSAVRADVKSETSKWMVSVAAFNALTPRLDRIQSKRSLRNELLAIFPQFQYQFDSASAEHATVDQVRRFIGYFQAKLKNY
jgi:hypothetical protein